MIAEVAPSKVGRKRVVPVLYLEKQDSWLSQIIHVMGDACQTQS